MYHATRQPENVANILDNGFRISQGSGFLLGDGLYVSRDIEKTLSYGDVCFKLLVYPGKTLRVEDQEDPLRTSWQGDFSSAWVPPYCGMVPSGREETCVKSSAQVRILGIAYGHDLLDLGTQARVRDAFGTGDNINPLENRALDAMLEDLGIVYSTLVNEGSRMFLDNVRGEVRVSDWSGEEEQLWSRTWDNCLENKATGEVLALNGDDLVMEEVEAAGDKSQKWKLDGRGRLLHKGSNRLLAHLGQGRVQLKHFNQADRESWRFRCMDETTRGVDTFVNYTPWQDMLSWA